MLLLTRPLFADLVEQWHCLNLRSGVRDVVPSGSFADLMSSFRKRTEADVKQVATPVLAAL